MTNTLFPSRFLRSLLIGTAVALALSSGACADPPGGDAPGNSGDAPGHSGDAPGNSGDAPGHSGDAGGASNGNGFGNSDEAPGKADHPGKPETAGKSDAAREGKPNLKSELAGLNSIQRNINGLMKSSDPRLALLRDYIVQRVEYETALAELADAEEALGAAQGDYDALASELGVAGYADTSPAGLQAELDTLLGNEPDADIPEHDVWQTEVDTLQLAIPALEGSDEYTALTEAEDSIAEAEQKVADEEEGATDDDLMASLLAAANRNRVGTYDDADKSEILVWAKEVLGVGDAVGALDDYVKL